MSKNHDIVLRQVDRAKQLLAEVCNAQQAKQVVDVAHAAEIFARRQKCSQEAIDYAHAIKVDAMTMLGAFLRDQIRHQGGRPKKNGSKLEPFLEETLADLNIDKKDSMDSQALDELKRIAPKYHEQVRNNEKSIRAAAAAYRQAKREKEKAKLQAEVVEVEAGDGWRVDQGDCLEWLRSQPEGSVHLVFGSPPYEQARLYLENGEDKGIARNTQQWVDWMVEVVEASLRCCSGLVAFVVEGQTKNYRWTASPALLMAALHSRGIHLRKPPIYRRVGIPGSGGPDWLRNDYEFIICATNGGQLPWSDNTAMGKPPAYDPGGDPSHREKNGQRVNRESGPAEHRDRRNQGHHRARSRAGTVYVPPAIANPGNVIDCVVGGGSMGDRLAHENEAPFPEGLAEFFIRSFCPLGGVVCDPFSGSGTTGAMAVKFGRRFLGCDLRGSQVQLSRKRIARVQPFLKGVN